MFSHGWIRLAPFVEDKATGERYVLRLRSVAVDLAITEADGGVLAATDAALAAGPDRDRRKCGDAVTWMLGLDPGFFGVLRTLPA